MKGFGQEINPVTTELEQSNASALAIISAGLISLLFLLFNIAFLYIIHMNSLIFFLN